MLLIFMTAPFVAACAVEMAKYSGKDGHHLWGGKTNEVGWNELLIFIAT